MTAGCVQLVSPCKSLSSYQEGSHVSCLCYCNLHVGSIPIFSQMTNRLSCGDQSHTATKGKDFAKRNYMLLQLLTRPLSTKLPLCGPFFFLLMTQNRRLQLLFDHAVLQNDPLTINAKNVQISVLEKLYGVNHW